LLTMKGPPAFHLLAKSTGPICNLDCEYCFFLSKEMLYPGDRFRMADELLEAYISQLLESHLTPDVTVPWQGGEPTMMGLDFFRRSVELVDKHRRPHQRIAYTIQTNGTLIDEDWAVFFKENDVLVGLSVDGPEELHDAYRVDTRGLGSFDRVMRGFEALKAQDVDVNILCTVHAANAEHPLDVYRLFPRRPGGSVHPVHPDRGAVAIFDDWIESDVGQVYVQMFDVALANWHGEPPGLCIFSETCGLALALEHNGDLYSCDHYVEPDYLLGNIMETPMIELVGSAKQQAFGQAKRDTLPQFCLDCDVRFACHGGCPQNRFTQTPDGDEGLNYLCAGYKNFFHHVDRPMQIMSALLGQGRAPSEVGTVLAAEEAARFADAGRNDPCPCLSGLKYKKCHGSTGTE
jgi:uncharacterized protein